MMDRRTTTRTMLNLTVLGMFLYCARVEFYFTLKPIHSLLGD